MLCYIIYRHTRERGERESMGHDGEPWCAGFVRMKDIKQGLVEVLDSKTQGKVVVVNQFPYFG